MEAALDHPVWNALTTRQSGFSFGTGAARRFDPDVSAFAATRDNDPKSLSDLVPLIGAGGDNAYLLQRGGIELPENLTAGKTALGVQLVKRRTVDTRAISHPIEALTETDIPAMCALTDLTKPGPFKPRTFEMGEYWGVKIDGRLAAMAGERLKLPGFTEVSGVCTHPDDQGKGLAAALSDHVANRIAARGETPFIHAFADNTGAIRLYEKLGFDLRCDLNVAVVERAT
jgi:ribosomal protein S18 acetylase RimI-like enzyme